MNAERQDEYMTIRGSSEYLAGVSERAIRERIRKGDLKAYRFGRRVLLRKSDVDAYVSQQAREREQEQAV
jgi:excisionase family DNA binding protein